MSGEGRHPQGDGGTAVLLVEKGDTLRATAVLLLNELRNHRRLKIDAVNVESLLFT